MQIELTPQESSLIIEILSKLTVNPTAPDAGTVVALIQGLAVKLRPETPAAEPEPSAE